MLSRLVLAGIFVIVMICVSCGGPPSYTTPLVSSGNVVQSECFVPENGTLPDEEIEVKVIGGDILVMHSNILMPENTLLGLEDLDGYVTYEKMQSYYYLEAGEQFINIREKFKISSSEKNCFYNLAVRVSNVSGGIYHLSIYGNGGEQIYSKEVSVR
jgi:hypothetical protein